MNKNRKAAVLLMCALALVLAMWVYYKFIPDVYKSHYAISNEFPRFLYNGLVMFPLTVCAVSVLVAFCIMAFIERLNLAARLVLLLLTALAILFPIQAFYISSATRLNEFNVFCHGVTENTNFDLVISWSKELIKLEDKGLKEPTTVPDNKVPPEVMAIFPRQLGDPDFVNVNIQSYPQFRQRLVAINYMFRDFRYGILVGLTNYDIPNGRVKEFKKFANGVFIFENW